MKNRYYVQKLTEQIFLVRERASIEVEQGPDDRIVRSFAIRSDAYMYVNTLNKPEVTTPAPTTSSVSK